MNLIRLWQPNFGVAELSHQSFVNTCNVKQQILIRVETGSSLVYAFQSQRHSLRNCAFAKERTSGNSMFVHAGKDAPKAIRLFY